VFVSASVVIHQFCRIGTFTILSGLSAINQDVPPFLMVGGRPAVAMGLNTVGLKRAGFKPDVRTDIKRAFKLLYASGFNIPHALEEIDRQCVSRESRDLAAFVKNSERGICGGTLSDDVRF
jgi:UDP-N-acetylglucosamine acyltransferase